MNFQQRLEISTPSGLVSVATNEPPVFIAEIGINHGGDIKLASEMVQAAAEAGAHVAKFQHFTADDLYFKEKAPAGVYEIFDKAALSPDQLARLAEECAKTGLGFAATPFGPERVTEVAALKPCLWKVASGDIVNPFLLEAVLTSEVTVPVIVSTGASTDEEVRRAVEFLSESGREDFMLLYCVSMYPTPPEKLHLSKIIDWREHFGCLIGFSDHTEGSWATAPAVYFGARVFEKHFTTDCSLPGPDNALSADPATFAAMVSAAQAAFRSTMAAVEQPNPEESEGNKFGRRALYSTDGELLAADKNEYPAQGSHLAAAADFRKRWAGGEVRVVRPNEQGIDLFDYLK